MVLFMRTKEFFKFCFSTRFIACFLLARGTRSGICARADQPNRIAVTLQARSSNKAQSAAGHSVRWSEYVGSTSDLPVSAPIAPPAAHSSGTSQASANPIGGAGGGSSKKRSATTRPNEYVQMPRAQPPTSEQSPAGQSFVNPALLSKCSVPRSQTMTGISAFANNGLPPPPPQPQAPLADTQCEEDSVELQSRSSASVSARARLDKPDSGKSHRSKFVSFFMPRSRTRPDIASSSAGGASNGAAHPEPSPSHSLLPNYPSNAAAHSTELPPQVAFSAEKRDSRQQATGQKKSSSKSTTGPLRLTDFTDSVQLAAIPVERQSQSQSQSQRTPERAMPPLEFEPSASASQSLAIGPNDSYQTHAHATAMYAQYAPRGIRGTTSLYFAGAVPGAEGDAELPAAVGGMNRSESFFPPPQVAAEGYMRDTYGHLQQQYSNLPCVQELPQQSEDEHASGGSLPWKPRSTATAPMSMATSADVPISASVAQHGVGSGGSTYTMMHNNEMVQVRLRQPLPAPPRAITDQPPIPVCVSTTVQYIQYCFNYNTTIQAMYPYVLIRQFDVAPHPMQCSSSVFRGVRPLLID